MPELVKISEDTKKRALEYANKINFDKGNQIMVERLYHLHIGEFVLAEFLKKEKRRFNHYKQESARPIPFKFMLIMKNGGFLRANVATAAHPYHRMMGIPEKKFIHQAVEVYVGIRLALEPGYAEIYGYATASELFKKGITEFYSGIMGYTMPLTDLIPIHNLLERVEIEENNDPSFSLR